jgi:hypothetical protein
MVEDIAKTDCLASQIGQLEELPEAEVHANLERYTQRYGTSAASSG